jgi:hypothetical protein
MAAIEVFTSYSHNDEALRDEFAKHLKVLQREGIIKTWYDRDIPAGSEWDKQINLNLRRARIILLLVSADFIASDYCWDVEVNKAMDRHHSGKCVVIPIILRPCDWMATPFGKLQALPKGAKPVNEWGNRDEAFADIIRSIRQIAINLGARPASEAGLFARLRVTLSNLNKKTVVLIATLAMLALFVVHGFVASKIAVNLIENANFAGAVRYLQVARRAAFYNSNVTAISERIKNPLSLQANLIVKRSNKPFPDKPYPFNTTPGKQLVITPEDFYKLLIETIPSQFYLYVFETDLDYGELSRLFPPEESLESSVLIQNNTTLNIPAGVNKWRQLTKHTHKTETTKTIHLLASPWRAKDIEAYYKQIALQLQSDAFSAAERNTMINNLLAKIHLRTDTNFNCFLYRHLAFRHTS